MAIDNKTMELLLGEWISVVDLSQTARHLNGRLIRTPEKDSDQWRYPYSVAVLQKGIVKQGDSVKYFTISHGRSSILREENAIFINADVISSFPLTLKGNIEDYVKK